MSISQKISGKVAVVGASGFVGSRLLEQFVLNQVAAIAPVVRGPNSLARLARFDLDWRIADACDLTGLAKAFSGCESVVHAVVGDPRIITAAAAVLIPAAVKAGVRRVVYLSTASVHGLTPVPGTNELSPLATNQEFEYNNAKVRAEQILFRDAKASGVELIGLRPSVVFGPRGRWVEPLAKELVNGSAWLIEDGNGICNSVYVDNLIHAIQASLVSSKEMAGRSYLITDNETVTWRRFYERVGSLVLNKSPVLRFPSVPTFSGPTWGDRVKALHALPLSQKVLEKTPSRLKRVVKAVLQGWPDPVGRAAISRRGVAPALCLDRERVRLQQCQWQLPCDAAVNDLGYSPVVSFDDGMMRTVDWLRWAGKI